MQMKILVPFDFTPITRTALEHALSLRTSLGGGDVELLHVVAKDSQKEKALSELRKELETMDPSDTKGVSCKVRTGDIFNDIIKEAEEAHAQLLVMGTHGAKGLQKVLGSKAIKVITGGNTPFIVTQSKGPGKDIKKIVMPVDLTKESAQIVNFAALLAERFEAEVHIIHKNESDEWLQKKLQSNLVFVRNVLNKQGIAWRVAQLPGKTSFAKECMAYGTEHNADLYAIAHFSESILPQFDTFSQEMITNPSQVPVLIINAEPVGRVGGQYSFLTV